MICLIATAIAIADVRAHACGHRDKGYRHIFRRARKVSKAFCTARAELAKAVSSAEGFARPSCILASHRANTRLTVSRAFCSNSTELKSGSVCLFISKLLKGWNSRIWRTRPNKKPSFSLKTADKTSQEGRSLSIPLKSYAQRHQIHAPCGMLM